MPELGNPQAFNRYAYVYNNPLKYTDPTGHCIRAAACLNPQRMLDDILIGGGGAGAIAMAGALQVAPVAINGVVIYGQNAPAVIEAATQFAQQADVASGQGSQYAGNADPGRGPNGSKFKRSQYLTEAQKQTRWGRYQRLVTGKDYEEVWRLANGRQVNLDGINNVSSQ